MSYVKEGRTLSDPYNGAPASWSSEVVGKQLMEQYLIKEQWSENDYSDIADFAISKWKEMKNARKQGLGKHLSQYGMDRCFFRLMRRF